MFTGIIKNIATIKKQQTIGGSLFLAIETPKDWRVQQGDSIATNGVCLTVKEVGVDFYTTELMPETLNKTTFGKSVPTRVNLEYSLTLQDPLGGHLVLGHVDTIGTITKIERAQASKIYHFSCPKSFGALIAEKGSIAVDGISLTIVEASDAFFTVSLVDYTLSRTTLGEKQEGDLVNIEFDVLAKYIARALERRII